MTDDFRPSQIESPPTPHGAPAAPWVLWLIRGGLVLGLALVLGWALLSKPMVAVANNGDFARLMEPSGFEYPFETSNPGINPNFFRFSTRIVLVGDRRSSGFFSSARLPIEIARAGHQLTTSHPFFDLRRLGVMYLLLHVGAFALFLGSITRLPLAVQATAAGAWMFFFTDIGYWSFFNTFYAEAATVVYLLLWLGTLGFVGETHRGRGWLVGWSIAYSIAAILFLVAKPQNAVLAPFAIGLWVVLVQPWKRAAFAWWTGAAVAIVLTLVSGIYFVSRPYKEVNLFNHVFMTIAYYSEDPAETLEAMRLDPEYAIFARWGAWWGVQLEEEHLRVRFVEEASMAHVLGYYAAHPGKFLDVLAMSAEEAFEFRPPFHGNFEQDTGARDFERSYRLAHLSFFKEHVYPRSLVGMLAFFLMLVVLAYLGLRHPPTRGLAVVGATLLLAACLQYMAVVIGEGTFDLVRHMFLFNLLVDAALVVLMMGVATVAADRITSRSH